MASVSSANVHPDDPTPYGRRGNSIVRYAGETYDGLVLVGGFSKAYSSLLAFIACPTEVKHLLKVAAPPYLYSGPSPVASLATVLAGLEVNERRGDALRGELYSLTARLLTALERLDIETPNRSGLPIIEIPLRHYDRIGDVGRFLFERGVYVTLAAYPLVPKDEVGFRVQLTAANTADEVDRLIEALEELVERGELRSARAAAERTADGGMTMMGRVRRTPAWVAYLVVGAVLCGLYVGVAPLKGSGPLMNLIGLSPVIAILVGVRRHRPRSALPWHLLALGSALFWLGDLYTYSYPHLLGAEVPFPSLGDGLYVAMYPVMMAGLLLLVQRRNGGRDRNGMIDGLILTVGLSLPSWIALMAPYLHQDDLSVLARFVSVAYPLGDVILIGAAIRLALDAGRREPAFYLLTSSIVALLATDFAYGLLTLHGGYHHQLWLDAGWIASYLLWGAAGLHPSMARLDQPARGREAALTHLRLALLTCASLLAPLIGIVHDLRTGDLDYLAIRLASITLFGLVVARMAGLVRQQERSLERERLLSRAGAELVAATDREEIDRVAVTAASALTAAGAAVALYRRDETGSLHSAARSEGWAAPSVAQERLAGVLAAAAEEGASARLSAEEARAAGLPATTTRAFAIALPSRRAEPSTLLVASHVELNQRGARCPARSRQPDRTRARQRDAQRRGAPPPGRGAIRVARPPRQRPHHRVADRHHGHLSEPVDRTHPRLRPGRSSRAALRPPCDRRRPGAARAERCLRRGR